LLRGSLLPQRLRGLLPRLLVPHVVPKFGRFVLLQKPSGGVQCAPIVDDFHCHEGFVQSFRCEVLSLAVLDNFAIALVSRVVIRTAPPAEEAVVFSGFGDARLGPCGATSGPRCYFFLRFDLLLGFGGRCVRFGGRRYGRCFLDHLVIVGGSSTTIVVDIVIVLERSGRHGFIIRLAASLEVAIDVLLGLTPRHAFFLWCVVHW